MTQKKKDLGEKETVRFMKHNCECYHKGFLGSMKKALGDLEIRPPKKMKF
jgi:hypothetical protein